MKKQAARPVAPYLISLVVLAVFSLVFLPGLHGPFMFDDLTNISSNYYVKITALDLDKLYLAARSSDSGPLGRPIPMVSFAINHYFANGFDNTFPYKLTNLVIHLVNAFLVFVLFNKLLNLGTSPQPRVTGSAGNRTFILALVLSILWLVHPIQVNPVHYIVQRMTTLSATFVLLGLIAYLHGRELGESRPRTARIFLFLLLPLALLLGIFSKENAVLLVPFVILVDFCFFSSSPYWQRIVSLDRRILVSGLLVVAVGTLWLLVEYAAPGYANRDFTLGQRLLSETRILVFYLGQIFFPLINRFGLFHDYIPVSNGLFDPVTTLLAILFLTALTISAIYYRTKAPWLFFGWFWFLVAHSLESSFIALELAHEHRNYIALIGPLYIIGHGLQFILTRYQPLIFATVSLFLIGSIGFVGYLRSDDWKSHEELILAESIYHPDSPRAQGSLGSILISKGHLKQGFTAMARAWELQPKEYGYLLNMVLIADMTRNAVPGEWKDRLLHAFAHEQITPLSLEVLKFATNCALSECRNARLLIEEIARTCATRKGLGRARRSQCMYYEGTLLGNRGQYDSAIQKLRSSYESDRKFLHPLFGIAILQLSENKLADARVTIDELVQANRVSEYPRNKDLEKLIGRYNDLAQKQQAGLIRDY